MPRFSGWWGHDKNIRFKMENTFVPMEGAEGWQLSNPPILSMTPIRASLEIFSAAGIKNCRIKSVQMTSFLLEMFDHSAIKGFEIITPREPEKRGCQLSFRMIKPDKTLFNTCLLYTSTNCAIFGSMHYFFYLCRNKRRQ